MKNGEIYLTKYVDITKTDYDPNLFFNHDDTEEDKESVRQTRIEYGYSDDDINKITEEINRNQAYEKDEEDDIKEDIVNSESKSEGTNELSVKNLVPKQKEAVETTVEGENIALSVAVKDIQNKDLYKELHAYQYKSEAKALINNNSQSMSNMLSVQRDFIHDKDKYHSNENLKDYKSTNELTKYEELEKKSKLLIDDINKNGTCLCKIKNTFYYRDSPSHEMRKGSGEDSSNFFSKTQRLVKIVNHKEIISKDGVVSNDKLYYYILEHQIPNVEAEVFNPKAAEFFTDTELLYKNLFQRSKYLPKMGLKHGIYKIQLSQERMNQLSSSGKFKFIKKKPEFIRTNSWIIDFIVNIVDEVDTIAEHRIATGLTLNWLSYYFQTMESSDIALALLGNQKLSGIFWEKVIQPIFGYEYSITIDDEMLKKNIVEILKEKVFYRIGNISQNDDNKKKINQILKAVLIDKYIFKNDTKPEKIPVYGQILITSEQAISLLSDYQTRFECINMPDESKILQNLQVKSIVDFEPKITDIELDIFSEILLTSYNTALGKPTISNDRQIMTDKTANSVEFNQDKAIEEFIQSIKNLNIEYFFKVEEVNEILYKELTDSLSIGMIAREDLCFYFNCVIGKTIFSDNKIFLKILKEKDELFRKNIDKNPTLVTKDKNGKFKTKKRYLIKSLEQDTNFCQNQDS